MSVQGGGGGALHAAATSGDASRVRQLLSAPAPRGAFPLRFAGWGSGRGAASTRPNVNELDAAGCTPLQRAAADGHEEIGRLLLANGADVNRRDALHGNTALHEAAWKGYSRTVALLATAGAQLGLPNNGGFAPLHLCCQNGHNQSCRELLLAGCDPDLQNNYGDTALHTSARYGHAGVTRILISAQCRVSEQNKNGDTALHIAAAMGRRKLTRILLEAGCDRALRNKQNETARDIATRKDLNEIINIINSTRPKRRDKSSDKSKEKEKSERKKKSSPKVKFDPKSVPWSPYGCHYFPDPTSFPKPKLDTLPDEPLRKGEQYYLDLAGNICKGPVGVGYTCYCAPFFKHMEERLDRDKRELKAHIDKAHEKLDHKVTDLELKTQGQISELTRCVAAERVLCDKRHQHLEQWLLRGNVGRQSERTRRQEYVPSDSAAMARSKSLELLDDFRAGLSKVSDIEESTKLNSKSMELLDANDGDGDCGRVNNKITTSKSTSHILDKLKRSVPQKNTHPRNDSNRRLLPLFNFKSQALRESANVNWLFQQNEAKSMKPNVRVVTVDHHADDDFEPRKTVSEIVAQLQRKNLNVENKFAVQKNPETCVDDKQNANEADNSESSDDEDNPIRSKMQPGIMRNSNLEMPNYENVNPTQSSSDSDYKTRRDQQVAGSLYYQHRNFMDGPYFQTDIDFNGGMYTARTRNGVYSPTTVPEPNPLDYDAGNHIHVHPTESYKDFNGSGLYVLDGRNSGYADPTKALQFGEQSGRAVDKNGSRQPVGYVDSSDGAAAINGIDDSGRSYNYSYGVDDAPFGIGNGVLRQDGDCSKLKQDGVGRSNVGKNYRLQPDTRQSDENNAPSRHDNKYYTDPLEIDTGADEFNASKETLQYPEPREADPRQSADCLNFVNTNLQVNALYNIKYDGALGGRSKLERRQIDLHLLERDVHNRIVNLHILDRDKKKDMNMMEHNDSGYSTKVYGSSQGNSPSLSGQLEVDTAVANKNVMKSNDVNASSLV